jgi:hypothetical protein
MRSRRTLAGLALAVSAAAAGLFAAVPANAAPTMPAAADLPTYTCARWMPAPLVYPFMVVAGDCQATNGAPQDGPLGGPVTVILPQGPGQIDTATWVCRYTEASNEDGQIVRVIGRDCERQRD